MMKPCEHKAFQSSGREYCSQETPSTGPQDYICSTLRNEKVVLRWSSKLIMVPDSAFSVEVVSIKHRDLKPSYLLRLVHLISG